DLPGEPQIRAILPSQRADRVLVHFLPKDAPEKTTPYFQVIDVASGKPLFPRSGVLQSDAVDFSPDGKFVIGVDGHDAVRWGIDDGSVQKCPLADDALDVVFAGSSDEVYAADDSLAVHRVAFPSCATRD